MSKQGIFRISDLRLVHTVEEGQIQMIYVESNGNVVSVDTNVLPIGSKHMKVTAQSNVTLSGGNVLALHDLLPFAVTDAVFALEIYLRHQSGIRLSAVDVAKP